MHNRPGVVIGGGAMRDGVDTISVISPDKDVIKLLDKGQKQDIKQQLDDLKKHGKGKGISEDENGNSITV